MLMILPRWPVSAWLAIMWRPAAWLRKKTDLRLVSTTASQSSFREINRIGPADDPRIVDEDVQPPSSSTAWATTSPTGAMEDKSAPMIAARRPRSRTMPAVCAAVRPTSATSAPACASATAIP
jgi:hypothetical protein